VRLDPRTSHDIEEPPGAYHVGAFRPGGMLASDEAASGRRHRPRGGPHRPTVRMRTVVWPDGAPDDARERGVGKRAIRGIGRHLPPGNGDEGTLSSGSWLVSGGGGSYGPNSLYSRDGATSWYGFNFVFPSSGVELGREVEIRRHVGRSALERRPVEPRVQFHTCSHGDHQPHLAGQRQRLRGCRPLRAEDLRRNPVRAEWLPSRAAPISAGSRSWRRGSSPRGTFRSTSSSCGGWNSTIWKAERTPFDTIQAAIPQPDLPNLEHRPSCSNLSDR
jgi:hypothetical protein